MIVPKANAITGAKSEGAAFTRLYTFPILKRRTRVR